MTAWGRLAVVLRPGGAVGLRDALERAVPGPLALDVPDAALGAVGGPWTASATHGRTTCLIEGHLVVGAALTADVGLAPGTDAATVAAAAIERWGEHAPDRLRGDFALAAWRADRRELVLARDAAGARGLYLARDGDAWLVGSELVVVAALLGRTPEPDREAVACWLARSEVPGRRTVHAGVERVLPGESVVLGPDGLRRHRWWPPPYRAPDRIGLEEAGALVRPVLVEATERLLEADRPSALLLSGGLDSSVVAGVAGRAVTADRRLGSAWTLRVPALGDQDEGDWAAQARAGLGVTVHEVEVGGGSLLAGALSFALAWDAPLLAPNFFYQERLLAQIAGTGSRVLLDGEGGDEVFGVARMLPADLLRRGRALAAWRQVHRFPGAGDTPDRRLVDRAFRLYALRAALPARMQAHRRRRHGLAGLAPDWLAPGLRPVIEELCPEGAWMDRDGPRWWAQLTGMVTDTVEAVGVHEHFRRRAAGAGLRDAHPLRDRDLVALALRLPPALAFDPHRSRPALREAVRGLVPEPVRMRASKSAFDRLFVATGVAEAAAVVRLLGAPDARIADWLDRDVVRRTFLAGPDAHPRGAARWVDQAFRLTAVELWLRAREDPDAARAFAKALDLAPLALRS